MTTNSNYTPPLPIGSGTATISKYVNALASNFRIGTSDVALQYNGVDQITLNGTTVSTSLPFASSSLSTGTITSTALSTGTITSTATSPVGSVVTVLGTGTVGRAVTEIKLDDVSGAAPGLYCYNLHNWAQVGNLVRLALTNSSDTGAILKLENAGTGNYITADSVFSVDNVGNCTAASFKHLVPRVATPLTSSTIINATTTWTSGGVTLPNQVAASGSLWRIKAIGTYTAVSSGTTRNNQCLVSFGGTNITTSTASMSVLVSKAQTTMFVYDFYVAGINTTSLWVTGVAWQHTDSLSSPWEQNATPPASTATVSSGAQTIDVKFSMTNAGAGDFWTIQQVSIERVL